jgi:ribonucleotide reductase alpha subunit
LADVSGEEFNSLYEQYEASGKARKVVKARDLWLKILDAQMETGTPYILFKDAANKKSNQQNLGTIKSSNLCVEIMEYSDKDETAVCNLASVGLPMFVDAETKTFNYEKLHEVVKVVTANLNRIIDINFYPTPKTRRSNLLHRPIGVGVQGLSDVFILMDIAFHSEEAKIVNKMIFETIYHAALEKSNDLAKKRRISVVNVQMTHVYDLNRCDNIQRDEYVDGDVILAEVRNLSQMHAGSYSSFEGSPASKGQLQFDLWNIEPSDRYDWLALKQSIIDNGLRNSLLVAPMPTASTSQILGFNECFEPLTSNIYSRRTMAGEFVVANKYLMKDLMALNLWNEKIKNNIIANKGSVQQLSIIPEHIRNKYKTVWEMPMKHLIDMAADRGAYICQSQSLNLWLEDPNYNTLTSMHFYSWSKGLKTGIYYLRRKGKHQAQQFTIEPEKAEDSTEDKEEICEMCSA